MSVIDNPLFGRLGVGLLHSLWQGAIVAAALAVVLVLVPSRAAIRHAAAWLALALLAGAVPFNVWWLTPRTPAEASLETATAVVAPAETAAAPIAAAPPPIPAAIGDVVPFAKPIPTSFASPNRPSLASWTALIWLVGVVLLAAWRLTGWAYLGYLRTRHARPAPMDVTSIFDDVRRRLGMSRAVAILEAAWVDVPALIGWLRPAVIVPVGALTGMSPRELELILVHELAHLRRLDYLANILQTAIETALFYHPAAWWVSSRVRAEREAMCDDAVIAASGERLFYARTLAGLMGKRRRLAVAADGGDLLSRVRRILGVPTPTRPGAFAVPVLVALSASVVGFVAAGGQPPGAKAPAGPPKVVRLMPADGATDAPPINELRIQFDRPMNPASAVLEWEFKKPGGFRQRGPMRYDAANREFILPVELTPTTTHVIGVNRTSHVAVEPAIEGFQSESGGAAEPFRWTFATAARSGKGPAPKIASVLPATNSEIALLTILEVAFDAPMDPLAFGLASSGDDDHDRIPAIASATYDAARRTFALVAKLPANWNGELNLDGFRGADGSPAETRALKYRTLREPIAPEQSRRIEAAGKAAELKRVVEQARAARRGVKSLVEDIVWSSTVNFDGSGWHRIFDAKGARFKLAGDKFVGEVDSVMRMPYRVGGDGKTCWIRSKDEVVSLPTADVPDRRVSICDPFDAFAATDADAVIAAMKLEYVGTVDFGGRRHHRVRSWDAGHSGSHTPIREWLIDAATHLPSQLRSGGQYESALDFAYSRVNQPIPDAEFAPDGGKPTKAEPLQAGYTKRFLNAIDGCGGRMTVRWGMTGPKGSSSSGLN